MTPLVIPPLTDPTLRTDREGVLDLNEAFLRRVTSAAKLRALAAADDHEGANPSRALGAAFARAAAQVLERGVRDGAYLRALGYGMRRVEDEVFSFSLDDIQIRGGTTQNSADLLRADERSGVWDAEAAELSRRVDPEERVELLVESDQQLPAAIALVRSRPGPTVLTGAFASAHRTALERSVGVTVRPGRIPRYVREGWTGDRDLLWVTRAGHWRPGRAWAGWLEPGQLAGLPREAFASCRGLVLTLADVPAPGTGLGGDGSRADLGLLVSLLPEHVSLRADVLVGAPGVSAKTSLRLPGELAAGLLGRPVALAGARPFRLTSVTGWPQARDRRPHGDLAVWWSFTAEDTAAPEERDAVVGELLSAREHVGELLPGRIAAAVGAPPAPARDAAPAPPARGADTRWDPSARVVTVLNAAVDERGPGHFIADLRTGRARRLPRPLVDVVAACSRGDTSALDRLPREHFRRLTDQLLSSRILWGAT